MTHEYTLVLNCGSSSLKFAVLQPLTGDCAIQGLAERLGSDQASISYQVNETKHKILLTQGDHQGAISAVIELLKEQALLESIRGVGHRVVHGGEAFSESLLINADNLKQLKTLSHLAPLHNPVNLLGIEAINTLLPELPQVAVFDTAFHQTLPEAAYLYALPYEYYEKHDVRRYGFHGTSYRYVSEKSASILNKPLNESQFLIEHLGNGCSACAIRNGVSVDT